MRAAARSRTPISTTGGASALLQHIALLLPMYVWMCMHERIANRRLALSMPPKGSLWPHLPALPSSLLQPRRTISPAAILNQTTPPPPSTRHRASRRLSSGRLRTPVAAPPLFHAAPFASAAATPSPLFRVPSALAKPLINPCLFVCMYDPSNNAASTPPTHPLFSPPPLCWSPCVCGLSTLSARCPRMMSRWLTAHHRRLLQGRGATHERGGRRRRPSPCPRPPTPPSQTWAPLLRWLNVC